MGGLFKSKMPKVEAPARMPDPEDPLKKEAARLKVARDGSTGRQSTILSDALNGSVGKAGA